jgi:hypothetical protein
MGKECPKAFKTWQFSVDFFKHGFTSAGLPKLSIIWVLRSCMGKKNENRFKIRHGFTSAELPKPID